MRIGLTAFSTVVFVAMFTAIPGQAGGKTTVREEVSLSSDGRTVRVIEIENSQTRTYGEPWMMHKCVLPDEIDGVVWRIWLGGAKVEAEELSVIGGSDEPFVKVCWSSSAGSTKIMDGDGNVTFEGPTSEHLYAGPESSRSVRIKFGEATVEVTMPSSD